MGVIASVANLNVWYVCLPNGYPPMALQDFAVLVKPVIAPHTHGGVAVDTEHAGLLVFALIAHLRLGRMELHAQSLQHLDRVDQGSVHRPFVCGVG